MDAKELDKEYSISFSMPGLNMDEISVNLNNNTLTVKGEHEEQNEDKQDKYLYREIAFGKLERSLYLPDNVDDNKVDAQYVNGILKITIPKKEVALPKEIAVKVK